MKLSENQYKHIMRLKKSAIGLSLFLFIMLWITDLTFGQGRNQEVTIIAPYQPSISDVTKIPFKPEFKDTLVKAPEMSYSINSQRIPTLFEAQPLKPAFIQIDPEKLLHRNYLKAGFGNYKMPYAEFYSNSLYSNKYSLGFYVRHLSSQGGIKDYPTSAFSKNNISVYGKRYLTDKVVSGNLLYDRDVVHYYGVKQNADNVTLTDNDLIQKNLYLEKSTVLLDAVNVSAERQAVRTETRTSVVKVTPLDIKQIPSVGGKADLAQYLQVLPGVIFTGDQGGQLYIRGGSPIQNKVFLDGMVIYNPFHSIGLFSVFDTETIRLADIYTGGFNAEHGGRISSVMDITTRDGNKKRHTGKLGLSTFGANALIEGPIKKQLEDGRGSSSFLISAKNSYLEQSSKLFYDYVNEDGLPFNFLDLYGKVTISAANGSKVNLFGFNFTDKVNYKAISEYSWDALGGGVNFVVIPGRTPVLMEGIFAYSSYDMQLDEEEKNPRNSSINGFNAGLDFTYFQGKNEIKYGIEMNGFTTNFAFFNDIGQSISQEQNTTELGGFFKYKIAINKFLIEPGIRAQWYASLSNFSLEPRLAFKYNYSDRTRFKIAGGFYSQNLISARSDRDVVDLFYGFLSGPDQTLIDFKGESFRLNIEYYLN
jgi:hypothetical protein